MKTMSKQMISFLLIILLCLSVLPLPALATEGDAAAEESQQTEELQLEANSSAPEGTESPAVESTSMPEPMPAPEPTPAPTDVAGSDSETPVESEAPDAQDEPQGTPAPVEQAEELIPVEETEEPLPVEENPELPEILPTGEPQSISIGLDIDPISYAVVDEPLVKVVYQYGSGYDVASPINLTVASSHSFYALGMVNGDSMEIIANHFPGEIPVNAENLNVLLDGSMDVTMDAEYDPATGKLYLPARYMGHRVTVTWTLEKSSVADIAISANISVKTGSVFEKTSYILTLPSNATEIAVPLAYGSNPVVSQCGIDLPESAYSIEDGVLYVQASPLGGDITVTAYAAGSQRRMLARSASSRPTTVTHTRSADQIYYGYYTSYYTANGNPAFCLDPTVSGLNAGVYAIDYWLDDPNDFLVKCCYYLYGGPGYGSVKNVFEDPDALWAYGMCHAVASYAYMGSLDAFKGLDDTLTGQLVQVANIVRSLPAVPSGFECFVYNTGGNNQPLVGWQYTPASWEPDPEPEPEPDPTGSVAVQKSSSAPDMTEGNPCYNRTCPARNAGRQYRPRFRPALRGCGCRAGFAARRRGPPGQWHGAWRGRFREWPSLRFAARSCSPEWRSAFPSGDSTTRFFFRRMDDKYLSTSKVFFLSASERYLYRGCFVMSYFSLKNGLTPRTCKIHLPPSIVAISSCDINSLPQCQVMNSNWAKNNPPRLRGGHYWYIHDIIFTFHRLDGRVVAL